MNTLHPSVCFQSFCLPKAAGTPLDAPPIDSTMATGVFGTGLVAGMAAGSAWPVAAKKVAVVPAAAGHTVAQALTRQRYHNFNTPLYSLVRLATLYKDFHGPLLAYMGSVTLGLLSTNLLRGVQETWVRRKETDIRAELLDAMQAAYGQSLALKYQQDDAMRENTRQQIASLLEEHGLSPKNYPLLTSPKEHPDRFYAVTPMRRDVPFGAAEASASANRTPLLAGLLGAGALTGGAFSGVMKLLFSADKRPAVQQTQVFESIMTQDMESVFLLKNWRMVGLVFALTAGARLGKMLVDTLREVEVTRLNAATELRYQQYNWLKQDPAFHRIAEEAALTQEMARFREDLPRLKASPELLAQRIETLLSNRGRSSPPPYYLATPSVMLTEAKS
jgi:hypothetical protein